MADLDKSQQMPAVKVKAHRIPTREEHEEKVRKLWRTCRHLAIIIFLITGGITGGLLIGGVDPAKVVAISTAVFQVILLSYGMGFFVPAFLTSLERLALGIEMNRQGLEIAERTAKILDKIDDAIDKRLERADRLLTKLEKAADEAEKGDHPIIKRVETTFQSEMKLLRHDIRQERDGVENELDAALAEGEAAAEAEGGAEDADWPPCPYCHKRHEGPCMGLERTCLVCGKNHEDWKCPECPGCKANVGPHRHAGPPSS